MQQLQVFYYFTASDLYMGYYTKALSPESHCITTIVAKFGKFGYNMVPIGLCSSGASERVASET